MNEFITTPTSEDEYNDIIHNFFIWLKRQPQMQKHMNEDNVSTLVFQLGYTLMDGCHGQKFLYPTKTAIRHDADYKVYWEKHLPAKKSKKKKK
tara:strand:+ start:357 stop:635 length:279 start_codon:yes stop_codon:yes gene_type:complete